jgi:hypothetical protein
MTNNHGGQDDSQWRWGERGPAVRPRELFVDNGAAFENILAIPLLLCEWGIIECSGLIDDRLPNTPTSPRRGDEQASEQRDSGLDSTE